MKRFLLATILLPLPLFAGSFVVQTSPFDTDTWRDLQTPQTLYGQLEGFPHTSEFFISEPQTLTVQVYARQHDTRLSLIVTKVADRGVEEVVRQRNVPEELTKERDSLLGLRFFTYPALELELEPGFYRLEMSDPANTAAYRLDINGGGMVQGYWSKWREVWAVNAFYGHSLFAVRSPVVYWPLLLLGAAYWLYRKRHTPHA